MSTLQSNQRLQAGLLAVIAALLSFAIRADARASGDIVKTELFRAGDAGYSTYRIPAIAVTPNGVVLAAVAARFDGHGDWSNTDTMLRRSTDGGQTWEASRVVTDVGEETVDNATFIVDPASDRVVLMYQVNYGRALVKESVDDGATWSPSREITDVFETFRQRDGYDWTVLAMGPGHGITTDTGRMLVPIWLSTSRRHRPSVATLIYSDDHGATWRAGPIVVENDGRTINPSEHMLAQLSDGRIMSNGRTESKPHRRVVSLSPDGVADWTPPQFDEQLYDPICMASLVTAAGADGAAPGTLIFCNPDSVNAPRAGESKRNPRERSNLTLRLSTDDGASWDRSLVVEPGASGYSDLAVSRDGTIFVLYEAGSHEVHGAFAPRSIVVARVSLATLSAGGIAPKE